MTITCSMLLFRIGLAAAQALGKRGAHVVVSSRRQANVDKAVALLRSQSIQVTGTTCNVGNGEDREKLVQMVDSLRKQWNLHVQISVFCSPYHSPSVEIVRGLLLVVVFFSFSGKPQKCPPGIDQAHRAECSGAFILEGLPHSSSVWRNSSLKVI